VVSCSKGKLEDFYVAVGAVVDRQSDGFIPHLEAKFDTSKRPFWGTGGQVSTDGTAIFFRGSDLVDLLKSHLAIIGVQEFLGPQVVMKFVVPNSVEIIGACRKDKAIGKL
jgi:hypothetical protein